MKHPVLPSSKYKALRSNTLVPLDHDRTTICGEKNANIDDRGTVVYVAVRSCNGRGEGFKIVKSVDNFEHVQNNRGMVVAKSGRSRSVVRAHLDRSKIAKIAVQS
jgi:hypothetical protein